MIGFESGFLTVVSKTSERKNRNVLWLCKCVCGSTILVATNTLKAKEKKSCGCKTKAETSGTHGMYGTPTYNTWRTMTERCTKAYHKSYERYNDVGVDQNWLKFENFYRDMGDRPDGMTLDRINWNKGYCKENCRWATLSSQQQNKPVSKRNKLGYPGVFESGNKFYSRIRHNGNRTYLGTFNTVELAHEAYDRKGRELFGSEWVSYFDDEPSNH